MASLLPARLAKYYIIGGKSDLDKVVKILQDVGVFHINYIDSKLGLKTFKEDVSYDRAVRETVRDFLELSKSIAHGTDGSAPVTKALLRELPQVTAKVKDSRKNLDAAKSLVIKLNVLKAMGINDPSLLNLREKLYLIRAHHRDRIEYVRMAKVNGYFYFLVTQDELNSYKNVDHLDLSDVFSLNKSSISSALRAARATEKKHASSLDRSLKKCVSIHKRFGLSLRRLSTSAMDDILRKASLGKMGDEGKMFVISCFVPENFNMASLRLNNIKAIRSDFQPDEAPSIPPKGRIMSNFSFLTRLYGVPSYNEVDPSLAIALTFPLLFGAIVGDVGYGLVLLLGSFLVSALDRRFKRRLFWVFFLSSLSSIFFGFLFGEFFGNLIPIHPLLFYRLAGLSSLLLGSVIAGAIIMMFALSFRVIDAYLRKDKKQLIDSVGWLILGVFILSEVVSMSVTGSLNLYAVVLFPVAVLFIAIGDKYDLSEILNLFTNVVSYLRIAAVGLSSVMIAILIDDLGRGLFSYNLFLAVFVIAILHLLNIALDSLIAFLQALRLEYVEFLSKFLSGTGKPYRPLRHAKDG